MNSDSWKTLLSLAFGHNIELHKMDRVLKGLSFFIHLNIFLQQYDSSSLPALLFKARPLLGAEHHLQNINYQLENLLDQK